MMHSGGDFILGDIDSAHKVSGSSSAPSVGCGDIGVDGEKQTPEKIALKNVVSSKIVAARMKLLEFSKAAAVFGQRGGKMASSAAVLTAKKTLGFTIAASALTAYTGLVAAVSCVPAYMIIMGSEAGLSLFAAFGAGAVGLIAATPTFALLVGVACEQKLFPKFLALLPIVAAGSTLLISTMWTAASLGNGLLLLRYPQSVLKDEAKKNYIEKLFDDPTMTTVSAKHKHPWTGELVSLELGVERLCSSSTKGTVGIRYVDGTTYLLTIERDKKGMRSITSHPGQLNTAKCVFK